MTKDKITSDEAVFKINAGEAPPNVVQFFEHLHGRPSKGELWNCDGVVVELEGVIARSYPTDRFSLFIRLGERIYKITDIDMSADDPVIKELRQRFTSFGYQPIQIAKQQERERKEKERQGSYEAYLEGRRENARADAAIVQAKKQYVAEERKRAGYG